MLEMHVMSMAILALSTFAGKGPTTAFIVRQALLGSAMLLINVTMLECAIPTLGNALTRQSLTELSARMVIFAL